MNSTTRGRIGGLIGDVRGGAIRDVRGRAFRLGGSSRTCFDSGDISPGNLDLDQDNDNDHHERSIHYGENGSFYEPNNSFNLDGHSIIEDDDDDNNNDNNSSCMYEGADSPLNRSSDISTIDGPDDADFQPQSQSSSSQSSSFQPLLTSSGYRNDENSANRRKTSSSQSSSATTTSAAALRDKDTRKGPSTDVKKLVKQFGFNGSGRLFTRPALNYSLPNFIS